MARPLLACFLAASAAIGSLLSGVRWLEFLLPGGLPLGNLLAVVALVAPAGAAVVLSAPASGARTFAWVAAGLAAAWLPASAILAGNLALNFRGEGWDAWLAMSAAIALATLVALASAAAQHVLPRLRGRGGD